MKILIKLVLILAFILSPLVTTAAPSNTTFWGWVWYTESPGEMTTVYSWKLYNTYSCKLLQRYDSFTPVEKDFFIPANTRDNDFDYTMTLNRVYCKVKFYQCNCIYY